jgi:hypothetical protein
MAKLFASLPALATLVAVSIGALTFSGCAGSEDYKYGPPGGLQGKKIPDPSGGGGDDPPPPPPGDGGGQNLNCAVSFKTDLHPLMLNGAWKCGTANCHQVGATEPPIASDPGAAYTALVARRTGGKPYFNPNSTDPAQSTFLCNLKGEAGCGTKMPIVGTGATAPTPEELTKVETWVKCGAPNN